MLTKELVLNCLKQVQDPELFKDIVTLGMVKELDVDPHKKRFDSFMEPHDHFHCRVCDNVYDINLKTTPMVEKTHHKKMEGHHIDTISVNVKGICRYCENGDA